MAPEVTLREVVDDDLPHFFAQQRDPLVHHQVAFTRRDPDDRDAFDAHWARIRADATIVLRTVLADGAVAGYLCAFPGGHGPEVGYWLGAEHAGRGVATRALAAFLRVVSERPLFAVTVHDHAASIRVLEKCGFVVRGRIREFARARGAEVDALLFELPAGADA